ncbi:MATE efflux family protein 7 [Hibiscus syriacus]|uniref:MATE efflux family protein 7 n=1 Tax=Hibiscus syriacus TaxID=106335 RepID=A0A6A2Y8C6_HIBSY|nr:MATE efflux family protein 7 [Hibiscus syriacus]
MDEALLQRKGGRICEILTWEVVVEELKRLSFFAAPFLAVAFSQCLLQVVSMTMAGHLGELPLSGSFLPIPEIGPSIVVHLARNTVFPCVPLLGFGIRIRVRIHRGGIGYRFIVLVLRDLARILHGVLIVMSGNRTLYLKDVFMSVQKFFRFAVPSAVMCCLEWWCFEILVLMSGLLPNSKLETSVLSICLSSDALHYNIPLGISIAASTRISNALGAGNPQAAQVTSFVSLLLTLVETLIASTILFCCLHVFGYDYSSENEVVLKVARIDPLVCLSLIADGLHEVACGMVRGMGWQHIGAYANLRAYYLAGIPAAII